MKEEKINKVITTGVMYRDENKNIKTLIINKTEIAIIDGLCFANAVINKEELKKVIGRDFDSVFCSVEEKREDSPLF